MTFTFAFYSLYYQRAIAGCLILSITSVDMCSLVEWINEWNSEYWISSAE